MTNHFPTPYQFLGWVLTDGKSAKGDSNATKSTNGTWLYIGEEMTIYNGMIFKAN